MSLLLSRWLNAQKATELLAYNNLEASHIFNSQTLLLFKSKD